MLALALVLLQAAPVEPPRAQWDRGRQFLPLETELGVGLVDWDALERLVTFEARPRPRFEDHCELTVRVAFQPTAAAGLGPGRVAVAGRDGPRVRVELWSIEDARAADGSLAWHVAERACIWERVDDDSIGVLMWNPVPPEGVATSLRVLWHGRRELVRLDVDARGWGTPTLEATPHEPVTRGVLHAPDLAGPLQRHFQARHDERGLVLMLRNPPVMLGICEGFSEEDTVQLALLDRDRDGRLDDVRRVDGPRWSAEDWGQLQTYERVFAPNIE